MDELYSEASRCTMCAGKAILSRAAARRFIEISDGQLAGFACPDRSAGWHLRNPTVELDNVVSR